MRLLNVIALAGSVVSLLRFFRRLGVFGIFFLSVLDSSFLVLPFGNDLLLIGLTSSDRSGVTWIAYVVVAAMGSVLGVLLVDIPMRETGEKGLKRFLNSSRLEKLKNKMKEKAGVTIFLATVLPPPFPFTPVIMTSSALQYPRSRLLAIVLGGRLLRYAIEAILALYFGRKLIRYINSDAFAYVVYGLIAVAIVTSAISILKWRSRAATEVAVSNSL